MDTEILHDKDLNARNRREDLRGVDSMAEEKSEMDDEFDALFAVLDDIDSQGRRGNVWNAIARVT